MDKKTINEEQFKKLVISEAKKIFSKEKITQNKMSENIESKRKITFDKVESLIKEIENMPKTLKSISFDDVELGGLSENIQETKSIRDFDVDGHNKKKNVLHVNEGEKDKWNRMLSYNIPTDEQR